MEKIACAFTGHRPKSFPWKYDESALDCILLKEVLATQIKALADRGRDRFPVGDCPEGGHLVRRDRPRPQKEKSCAKPPLHLALQRTGEQVDNISTGTLPLHFGAGQ